MDSATSTQDRHLVAALRSGDEAAFLSCVNQYQGSMLRICQIFVDNPDVAAEVVQDTWLDMLQGLERFEGRSSLKTWLFSILTNKAKTRARRERRSVPFSDLEPVEPEELEPTVEPERFLPAGHLWAGHWALKPQPWGRSVEEAVISSEVLACIQEAISGLPQAQRAVVSLRDIEGWSSEEVCNVLRLAETNQRVLLHRARSKLRRALELYFEGKATGT